MPQTDYVLTIDDKNVLVSLKKVDGEFNKMGKTGDDAMKRVSKSGMNMGSIMNVAVGGAFTALGGAAVEFGKQAVAAFAEVVKSSTQAAIEFDVTRKKFISIFEGQEGAADAVMDKISKRASELGLDMNEALSISRSFLPDVKGTEDPLGAIDDLLVGVRALAEEDPAQGIIGARIAIDEAMSGSLRSLKARFEFTKAEVDILKKAQGELGEVVGTIEGINEVMRRRGVDVEAMKGTFTQAMGEMEFATGKLRVELGKPIANQMTENMTALNKIMVENSDDLELVAAGVGDLVSEVVDFIGTGLTDYLDSIDFSDFVELTTALKQTLAAAELVIDILFDIPEAGDGVDQITRNVVQLRNAMLTVAQIADKLRVALQAMAVGFKIAFELQQQNIKGAFDAAKEFKDIFSLENVEEAVDSSEAAFERFRKKMVEMKETEEEREKAQDKNTEADLAQAEAFLKEGDAASKTADQLAELGLAEEDLTKIQEDIVKTQKKLVDADKKSTQERLDIARDFLQERADMELDFSQERIDIERKSLAEIAAIENDHQQAIEDQGLELGRDARDMGKKHSRERASTEKDLRRDLLDVEQDYQDELRRIQRTAQQAMEGAERGLDAQAFVEALRQQEVAQEEAKITRKGAEVDVRAGHKERLEDLELAQAEERATLQQADQDKLEDLQIQLVREFETQALSDQLALEQQGIDEERRLEQQIISEERRLEEQAINEQRRLDALLEGQAERLAKMVEGLDAETAAVVLAEANKLAAVEDFAGAAQALLDGLIKNTRAKAKSVGERKPKDASPKPLPGRPRIGGEEENGGDIVPDKKPLFLPIIQKPSTEEFGGSTRRRFGGQVSAGRRYRVGEAGLEGYIPRRGFGGSATLGQPTIVGEFGEELFVPPLSGRIIPNDQMGAFLDSGTTLQQTISNTENNLGGFTVAQSMFEDPIQRGQLENFILDVMSRN